MIVVAVAVAVAAILYSHVDAVVPVVLFATIHQLDLHHRHHGVRRHHCLAVVVEDEKDDQYS